MSYRHNFLVYFTSNKERTHDAIGTFFKRIVLTIRRREVVLWHLFCLRVNLIIKKHVRVAFKCGSFAIV